jgi:hypothetical protein
MSLDLGIALHAPERLFECLDGLLHPPELEQRKAAPKLALCAQRAGLVLCKHACRTLEELKRASRVASREPQTRSCCVYNGELLLERRVLALLVRRLEYTDRTRGRVDRCLAVPDALRDERVEVQRRRVVGPLLDVAPEHEEGGKKRRGTGWAAGRVVLELAACEFEVCVGLKGRVVVSARWRQPVHGYALRSR